MRATDIVKPPATTELEVWERWRNWVETQLRTRHYSSKKVIKVKYED